MKQKTLFKEEMKRDLMKVYREVANTGHFRSQRDIYRSVVEHPAPRFYVDAKWAHQRLSPLMRGDRSFLEQSGSALARQMYLDLYDVVMRLSQKERFWGSSLYHILQFAVLEPAPRFYISADRMRMIWKEEVVETRQQKYKRIGKPYEKRND